MGGQLQQKLAIPSRIIIMSKLMIDPPSGWKYGFPKEYPEMMLPIEELKTWLVENGYPKDEVDFGIQYLRFYTLDDDHS